MRDLVKLLACGVTVSLAAPALAQSIEQQVAAGQRGHSEAAGPRLATVAADSWWWLA